MEKTSKGKSHEVGWRVKEVLYGTAGLLQTGQSNELLLFLDTDSKDRTRQNTKVSKQQDFPDAVEFQKMALICGKALTAEHTQAQ